jgi:hypothetical protein
MILTGGCRPLRVVSSILDAGDGLPLICLIVVSEFFDTFAGSVCDLREALSIPDCPALSEPTQPGIASWFIKLRFVFTRP